MSIEIALPLALPPKYPQETASAVLLHDIAPHLASVATFAIHRGAKSDPFYRSWWFVSNVETGGSVAYAPSRNEALDKAAELLATKTTADILRGYRKLRRFKSRDDIGEERQ